MAEKRMFSLKVVDTDKFYDMPISTRLLYYELGMRADDDGFVSSPLKIVRITGCTTDDLKLLTSKGYVIPFDSGICVIKDWKVNNYIQSDRYKPTIYTEEKSKLFLKDNKEYVLDTVCIQNGYETDTDCIRRLDKIRLDKNSIGECKHVDTHNIYQDRKSQWFPASEWLGVEPEEISKAKKCFKFWVDWYEPSRRGNVNNLRPIWEQKCQEIGIDNFLEKFGHAFAFYCGTPEVQKKKIIMSAKKFLEEYDNWFDQAEMDGFKPVKFWERMNNHAGC